MKTIIQLLALVSLVGSIAGGLIGQKRGSADDATRTFLRNSLDLSKAVSAQLQDDPQYLRYIEQQTDVNRLGITVLSYEADPQYPELIYHIEDHVEVDADRIIAADGRGDGDTRIVDPNFVKLTVVSKEQDITEQSPLLSEQLGVPTIMCYEKASVTQYGVLPQPFELEGVPVGENMVFWDEFTIYGVGEYSGMGQKQFSNTQTNVTRPESANLAHQQQSKLAMQHLPVMTGF